VYVAISNLQESTYVCGNHKIIHESIHIHAEQTPTHIYLCWARCWARNVVFMCISWWVYVLLTLGVSSWHVVWRVPHTYICVEQDVERGVWYSPTTAHYIHPPLHMIFTNQHTYTRHLRTSRNLRKDTSRLSTRPVRKTRLDSGRHIFTNTYTHSRHSKSLHTPTTRHV